MTPEKAKAKLAALPRTIAARLAPTLDDAASAVAEEARRLLGARQQVPGSQQHSGHARGALAASISTSRDPDTGGSVVIVSAPYAVDVEYGTTRMEARPFLRPAAEQTAPDIRDRLAAELKQAVAETLDSP